MKSLSHVLLLVTPWTAASQAPLSMGFSRQEYWSDEKSTDSLMGNIPLNVICHFPLVVVFNILSLSLIFISLITMLFQCIPPGFIHPRLSVLPGLGLIELPSNKAAVHKASLKEILLENVLGTRLLEESDKPLITKTIPFKKYNTLPK